MIKGKRMKTALSKLMRNEKGQALPIVLVLLLIGSLFTAPLLGYMGTGLIAGQVFEKQMKELYAADAGVEDAIYKIIDDDVSLQSLDEGDSYSYTLTDSVNGISSVNIIVTKLSLLAGLVSEDEYQTGKPHEGWITMDTPITANQTADYVEYSVNITSSYAGGGKRRVQTLGTFFSPSTSALIEGPYEITYTPVMTDTNLESLVTEEPPGGFQFVWEWQKNKGPEFSSGDTGALNFKFKVYDPNWDYSLFFVWVLVKEEDVSYVTNAPDSYKWLIEATAEDTEVVSGVLDLLGALSILTWDINLQ